MYVAVRGFMPRTFYFPLMIRQIRIIAFGATPLQRPNAHRTEPWLFCLKKEKNKDYENKAIGIFHLEDIMKTIKKMFILVFALLILSFSGCADQNSNTTESNTNVNDSTNVTNDVDSTVTSGSVDSETIKETESESIAETETQTEAETEIVTETETETETYHVHTFASSITKEAACMENGVKTFLCECGESYTEEIPATGHLYGEWKITQQPTCGKEGEKERICANCGDKQTERIYKTDDHKYESKVTKEATYTAEGEKTFTCSICGKSYTEKIAKLYSPNVSPIGRFIGEDGLYEVDDGIFINYIEITVDSDGKYLIDYANSYKRPSYEPIDDIPINEPFEIIGYRKGDKDVATLLYDGENCITVLTEQYNDYQPEEVNKKFFR